MLAKSPPFLMWYDDNPKLSIPHKIAEAIAAYSERFRGARPTLVLVNEAEVTEVAGVEVRGAATVRRHTYWVGQEDRPDAPAPELELAPSKAAPRKAAPSKGAPEKAAPRRKTKAQATA